MKRIPKITHELRHVEMRSPYNGIKIGDLYPYSGNYVKGHEQGHSKVKRIFHEHFYLNNEPLPLNENSMNRPVWIELENMKMILLGFLDHNDKFTDKRIINY